MHCDGRPVRPTRLRGRSRHSLQEVAHRLVTLRGDHGQLDGGEPEVQRDAAQPGEDRVLHSLAEHPAAHKQILDEQGLVVVGGDGQARDPVVAEAVRHRSHPAGPTPLREPGNLPG